MTQGAAGGYPMEMIRGLRRGVRLELLASPVLVLAPLLVGGYLVYDGAARQDLRVALLGVVIVLGNVVFDYYMMVTAFRFLRNRAPGADEASPPR